MRRVLCWSLIPQKVHFSPVNFISISEIVFLGRGVFAGRDIPAGTQLDVCPVLVLDPKENEEHVRKTDLYNYT